MRNAMRVVAGRNLVMTLSIGTNETGDTVSEQEHPGANPRLASSLSGTSIAEITVVVLGQR